MISEAKKLVDRIKLESPDFEGRTLCESDIEKLENALNIKLPNWYVELYTTVPLVDAEFGVQEYEPEGEFDGISYMIWGGFDDIIEESAEYEPGVSALKDGYIYVASCSHGSGDPVFIKLSSEEHGVYRIFHDDHTKTLLDEDLTSLFKNSVS